MPKKHLKNNNKYRAYFLSGALATAGPAGRPGRFAAFPCFARGPSYWPLRGQVSPSGSRAASRLKTPLRGSKRRFAARKGRFAALPCFARDPSGPRIASRCLGLASLARKWPLRGLNPDFPILAPKSRLKKAISNGKKLKISKESSYPS